MPGELMEAGSGLGVGLRERRSCMTHESRSCHKYNIHRTVIHRQPLHNDNYHTTQCTGQRP